MNQPQSPRRLSQVLHGALPGAVAGRLPAPGLLDAWRRAAGELMAQRARLVCLEQGGVLVVAVAGSAWRQELLMAQPRLLEALAQEGWAITKLKLTRAATPPPRPPEPEPRPVGPIQREEVARAVAQVADPGLRQALAAAMLAQMASPRQDT